MIVPFDNQEVEPFHRVNSNKREYARWSPLNGHWFDHKQLDSLGPADQIRNTEFPMLQGLRPTAVDHQCQQLQRSPLGPD